jgi:hypothetical protein
MVELTLVEVVALVALVLINHQVVTQDQVDMEEMVPLIQSRHLL